MSFVPTPKLISTDTELLATVSLKPGTSTLYSFNSINPASSIYKELGPKIIGSTATGILVIDIVTAVENFCSKLLISVCLACHCISALRFAALNVRAAVHFNPAKSVASN